jgi:hypothetical protein
MSKKMPPKIRFAGKKSRKNLKRKAEPEIRPLTKMVIKRNPKPSPMLLIGTDSDSSTLEVNVDGLPAAKDLDEIEVVGVFHLLTMAERCALICWAYKSLRDSVSKGDLPRKGGILRLASPHWSHGLAYADPTVQWPPLTMEFFLCSNEAFRKQNAPYLEQLPVDFDVGWAGSYDNQDPWISMHADEVKSERMQHNINATREIIATMTKR